MSGITSLFFQVFGKMSLNKIKSNCSHFSSPPIQLFKHKNDPATTLTYLLSLAGLLSAFALLLLTTAGSPAVLTDDLQTTATSDLSAPTTEHFNSK